MSEPKCRICGTGLRTGVPYFPDPLLPGDIPKADELCTKCQTCHSDLYDPRRYERGEERPRYRDLRAVHDYPCPTPD